MSIGNTIKAIQDIMRKDAGVDGDAQRISQLGWMLFLKVLDDAEAEREVMSDGYKSPIPSRLRWRTWAKNPEGITGDELLDFVNNDLFKTLKTLTVTGKNAALGGVVRGVFEDAFNYMKSGTLMRQVINTLNEIDFNRASDRHQFGDIYEKILADLQSAGNAGEYYTPSRRYPVHRGPDRPEARGEDSRPSLRNGRLPYLRHRAHPKQVREVCEG